ncbi:MAG: nucleotidyltransferase family protein [Acidobacteriota bacterium]|nr:nucleotidyltransferase family protein [Acidobacteriota bacterium]
MRAAVTRPSEVRDLASEREIGAILLGERSPPRDPSSFTCMAMRHAMAPLLVRARVSELLPPIYASRLVDEARRQAVLTEVRERELKRVLEALHETGVDALLIKGAHLASSCYPESHLRTRSDTDLFVRAGDRRIVGAALARLRYRPQSLQTGHLVLGQTLFDRDDAVGAALDVHWRIAQPALAASLFEFDDLWSRSVPLTRLSLVARGPSAADALALACVHQAAHHPGHDLLLWMYDIHLLLTGFSPDDARAFVKLVEMRRMAAVCVAGLESAAVVFPGPLVTDLLARLRPADPGEPSAALLRPHGRLRGILLDLRALDGFEARARLAAGHLFPPPAYMRETFGPSSRAPLAWLYLRRLWRAARRGCVGARGVSGRRPAGVDG